MDTNIYNLLKYFLFTTIAFLSNNYTVSQTLFQKTYSPGENLDGTIYSSNILKIDDNNFIVSGSINLTNLDIGASMHCIDSLGEVKWAYTYGESLLRDLGGVGFNNSIITSDKNILLGGSTSSMDDTTRAYIIKTHTDGSLIWQKIISPQDTTITDLRIHSILEDEMGALFFVGLCRYSNDIGGSFGFIMKTDANGNLIWQKSYKQTGATAQQLLSITKTTGGDIVVGGHSHSGKALLFQIDNNGDLVWAKTYSTTDYINFSSIIALPNNEIGISAQYNDHLAIIKMSHIGEVIWSKISKTFQTYVSGINYGLKLSPDKKSIYLIGNHVYSENETQATLSNFTLDGEQLWLKEFGYCEQENFGGMVFGSNNSLYLYGITGSYGGGGGNGFLVRSDLSGYTSCMDDTMSLDFENLNLVALTISDLSVTDITMKYNNHNTIRNSFILTDSLICSSIAPVGLRFEAVDTTICSNSCISFINGSSFHDALRPILVSFSGDTTKMNITYKWLFPGSSTPIVDDTKNPTNICYPTPGKHDVSLIVTQGCKIDTLIKKNYIEVLEQNPVVTITGKTTVCSGTATTLTASGANTYTWSPSTGLNTTTGATVIANPSIPTTYTVTGEAGSCAINPQTVFVSVNTNPIITVTPNSPLTICTGQSKELKVSGATSYSWSPTLGLSSTSDAIITANPDTTTTYTVIGSNGSCTDTINVLITVVPSPEVELTNDLSITWGNPTPLLASGGGTYSWSPTTNLSCTDCPNPLATPTKKTNYCVTVTNLNNCTSTKCVLITVNIDCGELFIPNSFSPNGDKLNDYLEVNLNPGCVEEFTFNIFDRWGEKVFESNSINSSWDGKFNGKELDNAAFVYHLKMKLIDSTTVERKGNVSLIR